THPDSRKVRSDLLANFIEEMSRAGELTSWTVAVIGGGVAGPESVGGLPIKRMKRTNKSPDSEDKYSIGRLLSPQDEALDIDEKAWNVALGWTQKEWKPDPTRSRSKELPIAPSGPCIRRIRGFGSETVTPTPEKGLLLISLLDPEQSDLSGVEIPVIAFAISFPSSNAGKSVPYIVTNLL
ncbi:MAG: endonuclease, partial [Pseudomonadaceae bacterium]|nr:endonuclease [Pseudomonadaceae bacterium]